MGGELKEGWEGGSCGKSRRSKPSRSKSSDKRPEMGRVKARMRAAQLGHRESNQRGKGLSMSQQGQTTPGTAESRDFKSDGKLLKGSIMIQCQS